jgi:hypothetical protein
MSEETPSQAEGERDLTEEETTRSGGTGQSGRRQPPRTTPSQAEGEDDRDYGDTTDEDQG